jgi:hypothetical protein
MDAERTYVADLTELMRAAEQAIVQALRDGQGKHANGDWLTHSMEDHLDHAAAHLENSLDTEDLTEEELRTALSHLVCRAVMAWAKREES